MRQLIVALLTVFGLMFASNVLAETYTVKQGDTLGKIAKRYQGVSWQDINKANLRIIKDPDKIYIGQKLVIPVSENKKTKKQKLKKQAGYILAFPEFSWNKLGGDPVGKETPFAPIIQKMLIPDEVKAQFLIVAKTLAESGKKGFASRIANQDTTLKHFSRFGTMGHGKQGNVVHNVVVNLPENTEVRYDHVDYQEFRYYLVLPLACYNWASFREVKTSLQVPRKFTGKIVPEESEGEIVSIVPSPLKKQDLKTRWINYKPKVSADSWAWAGYEQGVQKNSKGFAGWWAGGNLSVFPGEFHVKNGIMRIGPHVASTHWGGKFDYEGRYTGNEALVGFEAQYEQGSNKTEVIISFGQHEGTASIDKYRNAETADLSVIDIAHTRWNDKWQLGIGAKAKFASNNRKTSSWDGNAISSSDDPATDQTAYLAWVELTYNKWQNYKPTVSVDIGYQAAGEGRYNGRIQPGVKLYHEIFEPQVFYDIKEGSKNDTMGVAMNINIDQLIKKVISSSRSSKKKSRSKPQIPVQKPIDYSLAFDMEACK